MAKKSQGKVQQGGGKNYTKCIKLVKSPKTGAYYFREEMVHNDNVKAFFEEK